MISQGRAAKAANSVSLCQSKAIGTFDLSNGYNMQSPTAKLSDSMINAVLTEGLSDNKRANSPEMMMAAHKHSSTWVDPPASMSTMWGQRCMFAFDATKPWNSAATSNWPKVPSQNRARCFDANGKATEKTITNTIAHSPTLCGLAYQMGSEYLIWSATTAYLHSPCSNDNVGRIWVGAPHQGCRRGASYVRSMKP